MTDEEPKTPALEAATRLLAHRARSVAEMQTRLTQKGYAPQTVTATVEKLLELELLDDADFARQLVGSLARRGDGPRKMRQKLGRARVDGSLSRRAIEGILAEYGGEQALATEALSRKRFDLEDPVERRKAAAWLVRRGFGQSVAGVVTGVFVDREL